MTRHMLMLADGKGISRDIRMNDKTGGSISVGANEKPKSQLKVGMAAKKRTSISRGQIQTNTLKESLRDLDHINKMFDENYHAR